MKKGLFALVVLGAIAGTVAYKLKKNQKEKELLDEELEILTSVEIEEDSEETNDEESEEPDEIETIEEEIVEAVECEEETFETEVEEFEEETVETDVEEFEEIEDDKIFEYDFTNKLQELTDEELKDYIVQEVQESIENETEEVENEIEEEITEYDFSDVIEEEKLEECSTEEIISEEILENPFIDEIDEDFKIEFESDIDLEVEETEENLDIFQEEDPVQHTIDFKNEMDMEAYKAVVIEKGYVVTRGESPYQLSVLHIAPNNKSELLVNVYYLANQAVKHNGSYQGWQSRKVL